jgi:hypothetical protein
MTFLQAGEQADKGQRNAIILQRKIVNDCCLMSVGNLHLY